MIIELKREKNHRKPVIISLVFVAVLLTSIGVAEVIKGRANQGVDTSEGLEIIREAEDADIAEIEVKIQSLEKKDESDRDEGEVKSLKERFMSTVVLGDSITESFSENDVLNASSVISNSGMDWEEQMEKLKGVNPKVVFLTYCVDDILESNGDTKAYIKRYKKRIEDVRKMVPEASIFVNSLFPVRQSALAKEAQYKKVEKYNQALQKLCDKLQVGFVDNSSVNRVQYYEADGIHFNAAFYPIWAERMAEVALL